MNNYYFYLVRVDNITNSGVLTSSNPPDEALGFLIEDLHKKFPQYKEKGFLLEKFELMPFNQNITPTAI